ncbi:metallopeptidase [Streptomyces mangrovisoli]|uniref:Aminopeptidase N n=1 Tax=Streptomyces mangrovisoli TaxID=1428628 RepID=A0A1J4NMK3_9ACTN|nr:metallopeptidase [Streptomyces mangrovisoli]
MPRFRLFVRPAVAAASALAVLGAPALAGCGGGGGAHGTPGAKGLRDPYFPKAGNGGYDVSHYALTLAYDPAEPRLSGTAVITARATQDLSAFDLDLLGLDVGSVTVDGRSAGWHRAGQELTVRPPGPLGDGRVFRVAVRYSGRPVTLTDPDGSQEGWLPTADGALALGEPTGSMTWFPGNDHPSDKASYDISVTVPKGLQAVSNGELTGRTTSGGRTAYRWRVAEPMATYLATVAVGHYDLDRSTAAGGLPVLVAVDPTQAAASRAVLARLPEVLGWEERVFGPYPFGSAGAIVDRPGDAGYALETQNRPVFPGPPDLTTLVHELAHQWYGDSVTPVSWRDMWLNEGFATYAEWLWAEDHGGATAQRTFDRLYRTGAGADLWAFPPGSPPGAADISARPVYDRGAMVLQKVRQRAGDRAFLGILRGWATARRHAGASTPDFTAYVERRVPGADFHDIWATWLYGDGKPPAP